MKKLLFILLCFCGINATAQTILKNDSSSVWVGNKWYPKNTLHIVQVNDSTSAILDNSNTILVPDQKYSSYRNGDNGNAVFANKDSLNAWFRRSFFVDASIASLINGGYFLPMTINRVTTDTLTVSGSGTYTFIGSVAKSWKMPTVNSATGMTIFIINRGSAPLTINSNSGANDLDVNAVYSTNIVVAAGENYVLRGNSLKLVTVNQ